MMNKKDKTYCSIIDGNCLDFREKKCNECKAYKEAIKKAYNKTMVMIYKKYGIKEMTYQEYLP